MSAPTITTPTLDLARGLLQVAVPLWIDRLREMEPIEREETRQRWMAGAEEAGVFNEAALFRTKPGESERAFNGLAKCLAALAFVEGGATFAGDRWEAKTQ